jgi:hypothetical protein
LAEYGQLASTLGRRESECRTTPIATAGHDEASKVFGGCVADRQRAIRAALLLSAQRSSR